MVKSHTAYAAIQFQLGFFDAFCTTLSPINYFLFQSNVTCQISKKIFLKKRSLHFYFVLFHMLFKIKLPYLL